MPRCICSCSASFATNAASCVLCTQNVTAQSHIRQLLECSLHLQEAWTHLSKDKCCSIAFLDGGALQPGVAKHLGLSMRTADGRAAGSSSGVLSQHGYIIQGDDHVVLGCKSGEVVVCDANRGGMVVLKFPVFR